MKRILLASLLITASNSTLAVDLEEGCKGIRDFSVKMMTARQLGITKSKVIADIPRNQKILKAIVDTVFEQPVQTTDSAKRRVIKETGKELYSFCLNGFK